MTTNTTAKSSSATIVGAAALCALAIGGIVVAIMLAFGSHATATTVPVSPTPTHSTPSEPTPSHSTPVTPAAVPSAAIESLQRQLAQLNYYNGPITGIVNTQTTQAITYLQRDAHLPQTGQLNAATQSALTRMLATGNNQMDR
jgi:peptidoglycan hydrolase-like protein with peptidoglycan-binding domain